MDEDVSRRGNSSHARCGLAIKIDLLQVCIVVLDAARHLKSMRSIRSPEHTKQRAAVGRLPPDGADSATTMKCAVAVHGSEAQCRLHVVEATIEPEGREDRILGSRCGVVGLELAGQDGTVPEVRIAIK